MFLQCTKWSGRAIWTNISNTCLSRKGFPCWFFKKLHAKQRFVLVAWNIARLEIHITMLDLHHHNMPWWHTKEFLIVVFEEKIQCNLLWMDDLIFPEAGLPNDTCPFLLHWQIQLSSLSLQKDVCLSFFWLNSQFQMILFQFYEWYDTVPWWSCCQLVNNTIKLLLPSNFCIRNCKYI